MNTPVRAVAESLELLGIFPAFHTTNPGGIEVSGWLAWQAIQQACADRGFRAHALQIDLSSSALPSDPNSMILRSRSGAAMQVLRARSSPQTVLCWHVDLLRLVPLVRDAQRRVLFLHGVEVWDAPGWLKQRLYAGLDLVLANSAFTLQRARAAAPILTRVRAAVVPLGVGAPCTQTAPPEDPPAAVMLGRLDKTERYKGHAFVFEAWARVLERIPNARLWIIGAGDLRENLETTVRMLALSDHVTFFGRVDEPRKEQLLTRARCLLLPSSGEGFGLVYAEAMRLGRPSLVGIADAGREVVNPPEAGLAADPADPQALGEAIVRLLTPGAEWDGWSRRARTRHAELFTATAFQQRLLAALWPH
ncbi:MAG TPA: glycosyltransferase family 4 protein [Longimicrobiales bacterium]|nr:glycosyltransferase family 4 protein [Longimicrobiales bacterium]